MNKVVEAWQHLKCSLAQQVNNIYRLAFCSGRCGLLIVHAKTASTCEVCVSPRPQPPSPNPQKWGEVCAACGRCTQLSSYAEREITNCVPLALSSFQSFAVHTASDENLGGSLATRLLIQYSM